LFFSIAFFSTNRFYNCAFNLVKKTKTWKLSVTSQLLENRGRRAEFSIFSQGQNSAEMVL